MSTKNVFENLVTEQNYFHQVIVSESKPSEQKIEKSESDRPIVSESSVAIVLLSIFICFLLLSKRWTAMQEDIEYPVDKQSYFTQVPCRNCQFFSNNFYLNCAVNATLVLTKEAINCSDYKRRNSRFSR
jgi:hypothetical protein